MIRIGIVGCGKIAEKHLSAYKKLEGVEVTVTDIVERGRMIATNYGASWNDDPRDLVSGQDVDAIDVCVPTPGHADVILSALDSGKHVFCEKPLARSVEEAARIKEAAARAGTVVMVGYLYRFHPAIEFARTTIQEGIIGEPYYGIFRLGGRGSHKSWKHKLDAGGGAGNEMLVHMLDLILWYFGEPVKLEALARDILLKEREIEGKPIEADAEDLILLRLHMREGVTILCESDLLTPSYMNYLEVHGTNGSLFTSILEFFPAFVYCMEPRGIYDRGHNLRQFPLVDLFARELEHFVDCIRDGTKPSLNSVEDSLKVMRLLEAVRTRQV